jgi:hypothetical protein
LRSVYLLQADNERKRKRKRKREICKCWAVGKEMKLSSF